MSATSCSAITPTSWSGWRTLAIASARISASARSRRSSPSWRRCEEDGVMLKRIVIGIAVLAVVAIGVVGVLIWGSQEDIVADRPDIPFAPLSDPAIVDPDNPIKLFRVD